MRSTVFAVLMSMALGVSAASEAVDTGAALLEADEAAFLGAHLLRVADTEGDALSDLLVADASKRFSAMDSDIARKPQYEAVRARLMVRVAASTNDPTLAAVALLAAEPRQIDADERIRYLQLLETASAENAYFAIQLLSLPEYREAPKAAALLHRAAEARQYRSLYMRTLQSVYARLLTLAHAEGVPEFKRLQGMSPETFSFAYALVYAGTPALPSYRYFVNTCGKDAVDPLRADCRSVATLMANEADTLIDTLIANAVLKNLADNDVERAAIEAAQTQLHWRNAQHAKLSVALLPDDGAPFAKEQDALAASYTRTLMESGEIVALKVLLQAAEIPLQPPVGWKRGDDLNPQPN